MNVFSGRLLFLVSCFLGAMALGETNTPADVLQPFVGVHQITKYLNKTNVKGTLEVVVKEVQVPTDDHSLKNVLQAGILIRPQAGDLSGLKSEDLVREVALSSFSKAANGIITQHYEQPGNPAVHLDLTFSLAGGSLVVSARNCDADSCHIEKFYTTP